LPELPEVETVRRGLVPYLEGARILKVKLNRKDLRFPFPRGMARKLEGKSIESVGRRAK
jgi:formamidopyrimidine-DNA glycosylase